MWTVGHTAVLHDGSQGRQFTEKCTGFFLEELTSYT